MKNLLYTPLLWLTFSFGYFTNAKIINVNNANDPESFYSPEKLINEEITTNILDYPKYFTPNGDGYHDTWNISSLKPKSNAKIYIFDRYGKLLKEIRSSIDGWDGTFNGIPMPSNDYWFSVEYQVDGLDKLKQFKAHFTLKR